MNIRYLYLCLLALSVLPLFGNSSQTDDSIRERVYVQTDKQTYLAGELAWIKLLTTTADGIPASLSKTGYIELVDTENSLVQVKIDIIKGIGQGWMIFPTNITSGYYRLVAYTNYMRNEDREVFFEKNIIIINPNQENLSLSENVSNNSNTIQTQQPNTITLKTTSNRFSTREQGEVIIENLPEDIHTISISITGKDLVNVETNDILKWKNKLPETKNRNFTNKFLPEYEGHIIQGRLIDTNTGNQISDNSITPFVSFIGDDLRIFAGKSDPNGNIQFPTTRTSGKKELASSFLATEDKKYKIDIESPYVKRHLTKQLPTFNHQINTDELLKRNISLQVQYSYVTDSINSFNFVGSHFWQKPNQSYRLDEYTRFASMPETFIEFVAFASFKKLNGKQTLTVFRENVGYLTGSSLAFVDGIPFFDHEYIYNYNPAYVKRIDVYQDKLILGGIIAEGIVSLTTQNNDYPDLKIDNRTQIIDYEGTQSHRNFYMPTYDNEEAKNSRMPDFRHTLLWNADLKTEGKTHLTVPFYTSDLTGDYSVTIEGLTREGIPIKATTSFVIE